MVRDHRSWTCPVLATSWVITGEATPSCATVSASDRDMTAALANQLVQGVLLGGLYTLFATGLSLSAGVMRFVNIAHGDFIVLTCYALLLLGTLLGVNPVVATLIVLPIAFLFGFVLQRFLL